MNEDRTKRRDPGDAPTPFVRTPVLVQVAGPGAPRAFTLKNGEYVVGRDAGTAIQVDSEDVSRRHAKVVVARGALVTVMDLGSTNGTFVNGHRVELGTVRTGDTIVIGDARLLLTDPDTAAKVIALAEPDSGATPVAASLDLTDRQVDIARLVAEGLSNGAIAEKLGISPRTVTSHLDHIYVRLGINGRAALVSALARAGLLAMLFGVLPGCLEPTPGFVDPRADLLVDWAFDEPGPTITDLAAPGQDLELQGGQWVTGDGPAHVRFDGIDDVGVGPDLQDLVPTLGAITLEAHVRIDAQPEDWNPRPIVHVRQSSATGDYPLTLAVYTAGQRLELGLVAGDERVQVNRDGAYEPGTWLTLHGVYDGELAHLYVDGEPLVDPLPLQGELDSYDFDYGDQTIRVGGDTTPDHHLAFGLSGLRIWARAMQAGEVAHRAVLLSEDDPP